MAKTRAKRNVNNRAKKGTLDQKHTEKLNKFEKMAESLPRKREKLTKLTKELNNLKSMNPNKYSHEDIRRKAYLMDTIEKLKNDIYSIENCTEPLNYIANTLPILVNYYDNENIIDDDKEEFITEASIDGKKNILSYFLREAEANRTKNEDDDPKRKKSNETTYSGSKTSNSRQRISRARLYDNYLNITDSRYRKTSQKISNICPAENCGGERILSQNDSFLVCKKCGLSESIFLTTDKPNYKEPTQDSGTYAYKRINHLTEILSQLQAKESTDIPQKVFESIKRELKKRKINKNDLDIFRLRRILKKLNYRKYYEHVPHILQIINGKQPPNFSREDEMKIKKMFKQIQKPFAIYCPKDRKNFLNYSYVLHKFCELLDLDEYINYFPLLKNNAKLLQHDKIWKNICEYMRWEFIKSI
ncbi:poxvirus late transcription factor VLTF3-like protein [Saudi moumouvirus]|uniref:Putative transcription factor n=1 Tax=Moumouvirus sp. 'Monve' TaxID=1128131 RepID=H2EEL0_9VIRU|nr:putative transcription factor [Moumouvirus Monve]AQN68285.1 poxvirus late transcription factor VLTF3-like protein [Saudi moumouvirus]